MTKKGPQGILTAAAIAVISAKAHAVLTFNVEPNGWPNAAQRQAAIDAMQSTVNRYNAYGNFGNYDIYVYYNAGIPTAQANYLGSIGFGGTYPNERVAMHELAHYLGSGTYGTPWDGARGEYLIDQFDGIEADLQGDSQHFWPYGLNYDSEGAEINKQRQVAMVYAERADMGIGPTAQPSGATVVNLTASDPLGESSFNYAVRWTNTHFAQPGTAYYTGSFLMRTPASGNSFTFVGDSLTVNNTNGINGGLLYKGSGTSGVVSFKNLILDGGYVRHASGAGDLFKLGGKVTLSQSPTIDAAQGSITISANIGGSGSLIKTGPFPLTLTGSNTYSGSTTINAGTLRLAPAVPVANYSFDFAVGTTVPNSGNGGSAMNGTLVNGAAIVSGGRFGNAVSLSTGASVDINNPIVNLGNNSNWTVSAWVKTSTPGASILTKGNGSGWSYGNTIFYLGDGTGPGSGAIPGGVRWAGGFFQGSTGAMPVNNNAWHLITYVNNAGSYAIYVDGVPQPLSAGNSSFAVNDIGSIVRLGVSTDTFPADGAVNFNGLLDSVQFYDQGLSAAQVAALYQGASFSALPATTGVTIAAGATLDLNGSTQQIASLNGPVGSSVTLGLGRLTINSAANSQFAGAISGAGGAIVKAGSSVLTLSGSNTYSGVTTIQAGNLILTGNAKNPVLNSGGADVQGGRLVLDYNDTGVAPDVKSILAAGFAQPTKFSTGQLRTSNPPDPAKGLGWNDDASAKHETIAYTYYGDANLDGQVDVTDLGALATHWQTNNVWGGGDFNYDGFVDVTDLGALATNWQAGVASPLDFDELSRVAPTRLDEALAAVGLSSVAVPEPASLVLLLTALQAVAPVAARRRGSRRR